MNEFPYQPPHPMGGTDGDPEPRDIVMVVYQGRRVKSYSALTLVLKNENLFEAAESLKIWNHSPDGFNWGYQGSGPAQLALALLYDVCQDAQTAVRLHQAFKRDLVAGWGDTWVFTNHDIINWICENIL